MTLNPSPLRPGDTVALVSPSGPVPAERLDAAVAVLTGWGLSVRVGEHALARDRYLAGADRQRLADLNAALADPEVRGVLTIRGGYGMQRIIDGVDLEPLRRDPKLVMGFSDVTALLLAIWRETGLATVHGPVAAQFDRGADTPTALAAYAALFGTGPVTLTPDPMEATSAVRVPGTATGPLIGGNLCLLAASAGTRHAPDLTGAVLLLEEVAEVPYRVDRLLTQLLRAGMLDGVAGVAVGQFTDCADGWPGTVADVLAERLGGLGVPVLGGLPIGHGPENTAVGHGCAAVLDADTGTLTVASAAR